MRLFKKKILRSAQDDKGDKWDKVAKGIAGFFIKLQTKFAIVMNKLFSNMPVKKINALLIVFCLSSGGYSIYLLANAIFSSDKKQSSFKVDQVDVPKHFDKTGDEISQPENYVDEETHRQLHEFKQYMDSLKTNKDKLYDSIMIARPGLMDSILVLEQIYNSQKIK